MIQSEPAPEIQPQAILSGAKALEVDYQLALDDLKRLAQKRWLSSLDPEAGAPRPPAQRSRGGRILAVFPLTWAIYQLSNHLADLWAAGFAWILALLGFGAVFAYGIVQLFRWLVRREWRLVGLFDERRVTLTPEYLVTWSAVSGERQIPWTEIRHVGFDGADLALIANSRLPGETASMSTLYIPAHAFRTPEQAHAFAWAAESRRANAQNNADSPRGSDAMDDRRLSGAAAVTYRLSDNDLDVILARSLRRGHPAGYAVLVLAVTSVFGFASYMIFTCMPQLAWVTIPIVALVVVVETWVLQHHHRRVFRSRCRALGACDLQTVELTSRGVTVRGYQEIVRRVPWTLIRRINIDASAIEIVLPHCVLPLHIPRWAFPTHLADEQFVFALERWGKVADFHAGSGP